MHVHAAEHFNRLVHPWSCAAAPICNPTTGRVLGVVDITGGPDVSSPQSLAMIRAAARMAVAELGGRALRLSRRHSEIISALVEHPGGLTAERLEVPPAVVTLREVLEGRVRGAVLASGEPDLMVVWTRSRWGASDLEMWERQVETLPVTSPLLPVAEAEVGRLERELGA